MWYNIFVVSIFDNIVSLKSRVLTLEQKVGSTKVKSEIQVLDRTIVPLKDIERLVKWDDFEALSLFLVSFNRPIFANQSVEPGPKKMGRGGYRSTVSKLSSRKSDQDGFRC